MNSDIVAGSEAVSAGSGGGDAADASAADVQIVDALAHALVDGALPGEIADFTDADRIAAAQFIAACAARRAGRNRPRPARDRWAARSAIAGCGSASSTTTCPSWSIRVANTLAARGLIVHRLLHPVVCVTRDDAGDHLTVGRAALRRRPSAANR